MITLQPIGVVRSTRSVVEDDHWDREEASIELDPSFGPEALAPALALWLGCFAALAFFHRDAFRKLVAALRERLAHKPATPAAEPPVEPQPQ